MKNLFKNLECFSRCPVCDVKHNHLQVLLIKEEEKQTAFHVSCDNCKTSALVFVSAGKTGIVSLGLLTDLAGDEAKRFFGDEAVSADCVIKVHQFLKSFRGGVKEFIYD